MSKTVKALKFEIVETQQEIEIPFYFSFTGRIDDEYSPTMEYVLDREDSEETLSNMTEEIGGIIDLNDEYNLSDDEEGLIIEQKIETNGYVDENGMSLLIETKISDNTQTTDLVDYQIRRVESSDITLLDLSVFYRYRVKDKSKFEEKKEEYLRFIRNM